MTATLGHHRPKYAIEVSSLSHSYGSFLAVDKISFTVPSGTVFGLIGPNGAGKTTTIKMLTTLLPATGGTAHVAGASINDAPQRVRQNIGYVPQLISADGELSGYENLLLSAKLYGLPRARRERRIEEMLDFMGLSNFADKLVSDYSGGMIRRLEIAQALLHEPHVLFLDEPTLGLDPRARDALLHHIRQWQKKSAITIFLTTHDMDEADRLCDTVACMHFGHIMAMDSPEKLKSNLGPGTTLDDVFIHYTGTSIKEGGDLSHVKEIRRTLSRLG
jgi:ABC-2 type transport system ATP-binding protein